MSQDTTDECVYTFDPAEHPEATMDASWECPHNAHTESSHCIFHMSEDARAKHNISARDLADAILENLDESDNPQHNEYVGANLPYLSFSFTVLNGKTNRPLNFQYASIKGLDLTDARVRKGIDLSHATISQFNAEDCVIEGNLLAHNATFDGLVKSLEATFLRNAEFDGAEFADETTFCESEFNDEVSFSGATFQDDVKFRAASFSGKSHELDDNADFSDVTFRRVADFAQSDLRYTTFANAEFNDNAVFDHTTFDGDVIFKNVVFEDDAIFQEARFQEDALFTDAWFRDTATFEGVEFQGGSRAAEDDVTFKEVVFEKTANFQYAHFRFSNFKNAEFKQTAHFEESEFYADSVFRRTQFHDEVDFDEARFYGDVNFTRADFYAPAVFRGAEFEGEANHLEDNANFDKATFHDRADFDTASFTSVSFINTEFGDAVDFQEAVISDKIDFRAHSIDGDTYVNFTRAELNGGTITQTATGAVPYDMTLAKLGDVTLDGETQGHQLLDNFRFCRTKFEYFDFTDHHGYLERNGWNIHNFVENNADFDYAVEMTPEVIEKTYLRAQDDAEALGDKQAAAKFDIKRNRYNRKKTKKLAFDTTEPLNFTARLEKIATVLENYLMDLTCGYGSSLKRIVGTTITTIVVSAILYMQGGFFQTGAGNVWTSSEPWNVAGNAIYYSIITITTVGYGDIGPTATGSKMVASMEALMSILILGLLVYTLGKRIDY